VGGTVLADCAAWGVPASALDAAPQLEAEAERMGVFAQGVASLWAGT